MEGDRPDMSGKTQARELGKLLRLIGAPNSGVARLPGDHGKARGTYNGIPCTVVWANNPMAVEHELVRSVSLVFELSQPTSLSFQLRNTASTRRLPGAGRRTDVRTDVDPRLLTAEEVSDLHSMDMRFLLSLIEDRVAITIYGVYPVECYESFLQLLQLIRERVTALGA